jgi:hypothetical protein
MKQPRVEPLSREAWERVERAVFDALDKPPAEREGWRLRLPAPWQLASLGFAVTLVVWVAVKGLGTFGEGTTTAGGEGAVSEARPSATVIPEGTRIVTTTGPTQTNVGDAVLMISEHSVLRITGDEALGWQVRLHEGRVELFVPPRANRPDFLVESGDVRVRVIGTRFSVAQQAAATEVSVSEGTVRVERGQSQLAVLGPGQMWSSRKVEDVPKRPVRNAARAVGSSKPTATGRVPPATARQRFEEAARLEPTNPDAALALYRGLAASGGAWAATALFAEARLELQEGRPERARGLLERYLRQYPDGANASDAKRLLAERP